MLTRIKITIEADIDQVHLVYMIEKAMQVMPDTGSIDVHMEPAPNQSDGSS